jgi:hypothetical protein
MPLHSCGFAIRGNRSLSVAAAISAIARRKLRLYDDASRLNTRAETIRGYR